MPSFVSRPKRMSSNHRPRPRSGEFSAQKLNQLDEATYANSSDQPSTSTNTSAASSRSPARSYSAPYSRQSPATLIVDYRSSSSSSNSNSRGIGVRPADHHEAQQRVQQQHEEHRRVVSLSWPPGESLLVERNVDWEQLQDHLSRRISNSSSGSAGSTDAAAGGKAAEEEQKAERAVLPVLEAKLNVNVGSAAPNKRQRQMAFSKKRVSSGPIDIPPSPRTTAAAATTATGARGFNGAFGGRGDGEDAAGMRGGRAVTDAGEWYPCWTATRPDDRKCGEGGGPPEHILIWERAVRSSSQQHQAIGAGAGGGGGSSSTRVSVGSTGTARGEIVGEDDSEAEDDDDGDGDDLLQKRPERRMSSDQGSSGGAMLFEMDM